jgi:hypothetical protein
MGSGVTGEEERGEVLPPLISKEEADWTGDGPRDEEADFEIKREFMSTVLNFLACTGTGRENTVEGRTPSIERPMSIATLLDKRGREGPRP